MGLENHEHLDDEPDFTIYVYYYEVPSNSIHATSIFSPSTSNPFIKFQKKSKYCKTPRSLEINEPSPRASEKAATWRTELYYQVYERFSESSKNDEHSTPPQESLKDQFHHRDFSQDLCSGGWTGLCPELIHIL